MDVQSIRFISAIILTPTILVFYPLFLLWIPLLHFSGEWIQYFVQLPPELAFAQAYVEISLLAAFFCMWLMQPKDKLSLWLLGLPILALPSLINANEHFSLSLFLFLLLLFSPGVYGFFLSRMKWFLRINLVDWAVMLWIVLGLIIKFYDAARLGYSALYYRAGGLWGSNHVAGILLLLLPLVRKQWVFAVSVAFLLIHFSLGIYLAMAVLGIGWLFMGSYRRVLVGILASVALIAMVCVLIPGLIDPAFQFLNERMGIYGSGTDSFIGGISWRFWQDERQLIWRDALKIAQNSGFVGVGLGGFKWGQEGIGSNLSAYSNAHNMYLTSLAEGGFLFAAGLVFVLAYAVRRAYAVSKPVCAGLLAWMFYGLYSGEIYEASRFTTAGDYYNLLFVLAYITYMIRMQHIPTTAALLVSEGPQEKQHETDISMV